MHLQRHKTSPATELLCWDVLVLPHVLPALSSLALALEGLTSFDLSNSPAAIREGPAAAIYSASLGYASGMVTAATAFQVPPMITMDV